MLESRIAVPGAYNGCIGAFLKGQQLHLVLELVDDMQKQNMDLDVVTYEAAFRACEKLQDSNKALELFKEMKSHIRYNETIYSGIIKAVARGHMPDKATELLREMQERRLHPGCHDQSTFVASLNTRESR